MQDNRTFEANKNKIWDQLVKIFNKTRKNNKHIYIWLIQNLPESRTLICLQILQKWW